jgi:MFS family permease
MRIAVDLAPVRASRDLRLLLGGELLTTMGTQAALVALPYQIYTQTGSAFLTGLLGAVELVPMATAALFGGALADRNDRRRVLLLIQIALILCAGGLALGAFMGETPLVVLYVLGAALAGASAVEGVARSAIVPALVAPEHLRGALALNFGLYQLTMVVGPGLGGLLIAATGVQGAYTIDAASCGFMALAAWRMRPLPPAYDRPEGMTIRGSIAEGLRFVRGSEPLKGSFAMDLLAMTFGMPRALFPVLAISVYHAGAEGTGVLFAAVSAGATIAALTTGWLGAARRLGRIVIGAVLVWGVAIALAGVMPSLWPAAVMLAVAGAADSVSAVCRSSINQIVTPDELRGRMSSVFLLVVASGPRAGDLESGTVASLTSARFSVFSGGLACVAGIALVVALFPSLLTFDADAYTTRRETPV